jgi:thiol-disulfide isomerase/thioredoxin
MPAVPRFSWRVLLASTTIALVAALMAGVVASKVMHHDRAAVDPSKAPSITLTTDGPAQPLDKVAFTEFDGTKVTLASLRGTPLVVNFFASTCVPCITEMPALQQVHEQLGAKVQFLGLAVSDRAADAKALVQRTKVTYRTAQDLDASVMTTLQGNFLPTTVLIDAAGKVVATHTGAVSAGDLRSLLASKLGITT